MADQPYIVQPVRKALELLDCLAEEQRALSLKEISYLAGFPKATTYKYLCTLQAAGLIARDDSTNLYRLGTRLWELGQLVGGQLDVCKVALPHMQHLRDEFNETVNLGVLEGLDVVYVEMVESRLSLRMQARLGSRDPAYSTAMGKAIVAHLPMEQWQHHLPVQLQKRTPQTITSLEALQLDLHQTRARGFARDCEENEAGARCVSAPVFDARCVPIAAISLAAPAMRFEDGLEPRVAEAVMEAARQTSTRLASTKSE